MNAFVLDLLEKNAELSIDKELIEMRNSYREDGVPTILTDGLNELLLIANIKQPKKILELGTSVGCSGIALLKSLPDAVLYTVENRENSFLTARENFRKAGLENRVYQFLGDALEKIDDVGNGFDFVFLDCNKSKYKDLFPKIKKIMNTGGVLFADNVLFRGYVTGEVKPPHRFNTIKNNMRKFLDMITSDRDFITTISDVGDGVSISYKR
ncbi:MAG: O-methyltransferase [Clostridia bacterium]|nr:O-methyltransferase [Clostridia bacterium]